MHRFSFVIIKIWVVLCVFGCQKPTEVQEVPVEKVIREVSPVITKKSLVTWIIQGEALSDGALMIDSGAFTTKAANEIVSATLFSETFGFDSSNHDLRLELFISDIAPFDSTLVNEDGTLGAFSLTEPTHLGSVGVSLEDSAGLTNVPLRVTLLDNGIELEGKVSMDGKLIYPAKSGQTLHFGFLLRTDNIE